jgi:phosphate transport system protein
MAREHIVKSYDDELERLQTMVAEMGTAAREQIADAVEALTTMDSTLAAGVVRSDEQINRMQAEAEELVISLLARRQPMAIDLRSIVSALKIASELERIADYAANMVCSIDDLTRISEAADIKAIVQMAEIGQEMLTNIITAYVDTDSHRAVEVWHRDDAIDKIYADLISLIRSRLEQENGTTKDYTCMIYAARCCERIGDHITNVAEDIYYIQHGVLYNDGAANAP